MTLPFPQKWANANTSRRPPTTQENANGFPCGAADPDLFDHLHYRIQEAVNNVAEQVIFASTQRGLTWSETDGEALHKLLQTYEDIIKEDLAINVPADFPDVVDAMDYLSQFRIANTATVVVNVAGGTYNHGGKVIPGHPDGLRIKVVGPALASGMVSETDFQVTGSTSANITTDRIVNESMLRSRFGVRIQSSQGAVDTSTGSITLENIAFIGSGSGEGVKTTSGVIVATNVAVHNYGDNWTVDRAGLIFAPGCTSSGATIDGWKVTNNGTIVAQNGIASGNSGSGFVASVGGTVVAQGATSKGNGASEGAGFFVSLAGTIQAFSAVSKTNEGDGFLITLDGTIQARESTSTGNKGWGYNIFNGGRLNAAASNSTSNTAGDYRAQNFGGMTITGYGGTASTSPTVNTVGNGNAYIKN